MTHVQKPPHYLTEDEFSRVRFTEAQWEELRRRLDMVEQEKRQALIEKKGWKRHLLEEEQKHKEKLREKGNEQAAMFIVAHLVGTTCFWLILGVLSEMTGDKSLSGLANNPILLVIAGAIAARRLV
jgi:hypothetical protein